MAIDTRSPIERYENRTFDTVTETVKNYATDVRAVFPVVKAFLFGSWVKGTQTEASDVDVCFFIDNLGDKNRTFEVKLQIYNLKTPYLGMAIEPHVIGSEHLKSDHPFILEILTTGIEI